VRRRGREIEGKGKEGKGLRGGGCQGTFVNTTDVSAKGGRSGDAVLEAAERSAGSGRHGTGRKGQAAVLTTSKQGRKCLHINAATLNVLASPSLEASDLMGQYY